MCQRKKSQNNIERTCLQDINAVVRATKMKIPSLVSFVVTVMSLEKTIVIAARKGNAVVIPSLLTVRILRCLRAGSPATSHQ
jgi:hypothetical protein